MKKILFTLFALFMIAGQGWATCPNQQPFCPNVQGPVKIMGADSTTKFIVEQADGTDIVTISTDDTAEAILKVSPANRIGGTAIAGFRDADDVASTTAYTISGDNHKSSGIFYSGKVTNDSHITLNVTGERLCPGTCNITTQSAGAIRGTYTMWDGDYNNVSDYPLGAITGIFRAVGGATAASTTDWGVGFWGEIISLHADSDIQVGSVFHAMGCNGSSGDIKNCVGLWIEDQAEATDQNLGIVLDDGGDCVWLDGVSGVGICSKTVTLNATDIGALTTPYVLVSSYGTESWIEVVSAVFDYNYVQAVFAEPSSPDNLVIEYEDNTDITASITTAGFLTAAANELRYAVPIAATYTTDLDLDAYIDQNVELFNTGGNLTGGTGTAKVASNCSSTDDRITSGAHGFENGDVVTLDVTECGVTQATNYWVCEKAAGQFSLDSEPFCGANKDCSICFNRVPITTNASPSGTYTPQSTLNVKVVYRVHRLGF